MPESMELEATPSVSPSLDLQAVRSRISELEELQRSLEEDEAYTTDSLGSEKLLKECALHLEDTEKATLNCCSVNGEDQMNIVVEPECNAFEVLELDTQIEKNKRILKSLQELDEIFKSLDVIEQVEDTIGGLKVINVADNFIRLSLRTHIPNFEDFLSLQRLEGMNEPSELDHELLIEVLEGTMKLKNAEIFPGDVHLHDIINASKSFSDSSLEWFVRKLQDRIVLCTLRRFVVKSANKSSHSFEYLDQDETIICTMIGGIDAVIKVSQGWPLSDSPLKLVSLKSSDHYTKGVSLSLICKVEKMANSLDVRIRQNLSNFADAVEKILKEQMHLELQAADSAL